MRTRIRPGYDDSVRLLTPFEEIVVDWPARSGKRLSNLQRDAISWSHIVRNRARWTRSDQSTAEQNEQAVAFLRKLIGEKKRAQVARSGRLCVVIPYKEETVRWEARIMPWEYILTAGTRDLRSSPLAIFRWLLRRGLTPKPNRKPRVLFVESAPVAVSDGWDFDDERRLVEVNSGPSDFRRLISPTRDELIGAMRQMSPNIVHLAGFDTHQGLDLARDADRPATKSTIHDGYLMSGVGTALDPVSADDVAAMFEVAKCRPAVVFCNFWNSGARLAPLIVATGAAAAIGFQDSLDDAIAELFLGSFYRNLNAGAEVGTAFDAAWSAVRAQPRPIRGTGIVLWQGGGLVALRRIGTPRAPSKVRPEVILAPSEVEPKKVSDLFSCSVEPHTQISYALLHNNRDLFERFIIRSFSRRPVDGVQVFVELHVGDGTYPFRQSFSINGPVLDLAPVVRVALTSDLARSLDEILVTSLYVRVRWGDHELFSQTFSVTLAPVDQWADTDTDRLFLPSFVFPRDPAVTQSIDEAERYVTALRDDTTAGFDGYQSIDPSADDPAADVDNQVQAIWYALAYRVPISYINPPPTYAEAAQRIRVPSEVLNGGFGTCIDLALLVAACLEAVEIYPAVFLLEDHAFPGYWRTDEAHDEFIRRISRLSDDARPFDTAEVGATRASPEPWYFERRLLPEIRREVDANNLIPLESVGLTGRWNFAEAINTAKNYFTDRRAFDSMLDIESARDNKVTPLPLRPRRP